MKKLNRLYILVLILFISISGCDESYLEVPPYGAAFEESMATEAGLNGLLLGAYKTLQMSSGIWGNVCNMTYSGFATNEFVRGVTTNSHLANFEAHRIDPSDVNWLSHDRWRLNYDGIQRANSVLTVLNNAEEGQIANPTQIEAEVLFIRAVLHFELAKLYLNVPYVDESITFSEGNYNVPNTESIWPYIEKDFQFAMDNLAETHPDAGRPNNWAAQCFLAKVYMQQDKYSEALPLLKDAIDNGVTTRGQKYALNPIYFDNFDAKKKNSAESVFAVQMAVFDGAGPSNGNFGQCVAIPQVPGCEGSGFVGISRATINTFKTDDVTGLPLFDTYNDFDLPDDAYITDEDPFTPYTGSLDSRLDNSVMRRGVSLLDWGMPISSWSFDKIQQSPYGMRKFLHYQVDRDVLAQTIGWTYVSAINYEMIRFADLLLLAAECEVESGGSLANAEEYVNRVRVRAADPVTWVKTYINPDNPGSGFTNTPAANYNVGLYNGEFTANGQEYARKAYRFERRLELAFEGHYFADLQRWDNGTGYMADEINKTIEHEMKQPDGHAPNLEGARFIRGTHELFPVPQSQIDLSAINGNPTLVQNPGYTN